MSSDSDEATDQLEDIKTAKRELEIKLNLIRKHFITHSDIKVDHIFSNSGAEEHLKSTLELDKSIISKQKLEIERQRKEIETLKSKCEEAEKQHIKACNELRAKDGKIVQLESQIKALQDKVRQRMNLSSASSFIDGGRIPPPPPVDIPSIDEFLKLGDESLSMMSS